jgi:adenylosuccinate lyase
MINNINNIMALSVLDGRYEKLVYDLKSIFSEYGLIKHRVFVEIQWLKFLIIELSLCKIKTKPDEIIKKLDSITENFNKNEALSIKEIEKTTNHDVKAVEYYIKNQLEKLELNDLKEWTHFACTSEDINNISYSLMIKKGSLLICDNITSVLNNVEKLAKKYKDIPMMARTHGQPATPTTVGKEFVVFSWRIRKELKIFKKIKTGGKINGASGNYNAHCFVFPEIDWIKASEKFLSSYLNVEPIFYTTQINQYNYISEILHSMIRCASIIIDMDRDMWGYISFNYFKQKIKDGETGSSVMPHKVNPIDFENSEGNMGIAISMMEHLAVKLLNSRFQRDLSDSTVLRNLGAVFGYFIIGIKSLLKGLNKIEINAEAMQNDLDNNIELLAEPIQTAMRVFNEKNPYEKLKALTRGKKITKKELNDFIDSLENISFDIKQKMKSLTPEKYTGLAQNIVDKYFMAL